MAAGKMPYDFLLARVQRFAVRQFTENPELGFDRFQQQLGEYLFGLDRAPSAAEDVLALQAIWVHESDWYWSSPLLDPDFFQARSKRLRWPAKKLTEFAQQLERVRQITARYRHSKNPGERQMQQCAQQVADRWEGKEHLLKSDWSEGPAEGGSR
jgi:hypothetical protein